MLGNPNGCEDTLKQVVALVAVSVVAVVSFVSVGVLESVRSAASICSLLCCRSFGVTATNFRETLRRWHTGLPPRGHQYLAFICEVVRLLDGLDWLCNADVG